MSVVAPKLFQSTDTGTPTLSGTVGDLVEVLSSCLIIRKMFTAVSGASFVDNTTEARLQGGSTFTLFQGPAATTNEAYFGLCQKFERILFNFGTAGVQGSAVTLAWEYWNGSAWTALTVTDGTTGLTANGAVTFSMPSDWATTAVNSSTVYWVRLRYTAGSWSTNPLVNYTTLVGWSVAYTGTNQRAYQMGGGNQFFLNVNDNGPGAGTAQEARIVGYETMSAIGTGTNPFPTVAQFANGMFLRKSAAASATTRSWLCVCDDRTVYLATVPGDGTFYSLVGFGDFYSFISSDPYRTFIMARKTENTALSDSGNSQDAGSREDAYTDSINGLQINVTFGGKYVVRNYLSAVGATVVGATGFSIGMTQSTGGIHALATSRPGYGGLIPYPNTADGGVYIAPIYMFETGPNFRGRFRGFASWQHAFGAVADRTTFSGSGAMAGKAFMLCTPTERGVNSAAAADGTLCFETSDTWETNS